MVCILRTASGEAFLWPHHAKSHLTTTVAPEIIRGLLSLVAVDRALAAASLTTGQLLTLFGDRDGARRRWEMVRRTGIVIRTFPESAADGEVTRAELLELLTRYRVGERKLRALRVSMTRVDVLRVCLRTAS